MGSYKTGQETITPDVALAYLKEGNLRFINNQRLYRDLIQQVDQTSQGQFPFAVILGCIDSRTPAELIFDQGLGDIFNIRIAGNILNEDILGSLEFACKVVGSKLVLVLGHTKCGAISSACSDLELGHFTQLLDKIRPAIQVENHTSDQSIMDNPAFINQVTKTNIRFTIRMIREKSQILHQLEYANRIKITGAMYDIESGKVSFFED